MSYQLKVVKLVIYFTNLDQLMTTYSKNHIKPESESGFIWIFHESSFH